MFSVVIKLLFVSYFNSWLLHDHKSLSNVKYSYLHIRTNCYRCDDKICTILFAIADILHLYVPFMKFL